MALSCFVDAFNIGTGAVSSTVARTGYGFQPKACIYFWSGRTESVNTAGLADAKPGIGVACSSTDRRCMTTQSDHSPTTMSTDRKHNNAQCIECLTTTGALDGNADLQSFDSDGQTLVIDDQFTTNLRVACLALGGSDLTNAATFQFQAPTATGNADFTGLAFQPDAILLFSIGHTTAPPATTGTARLSVGVATASNQGVVAYQDTDAVGTAATGGYSYNGECIGVCSSSTAMNFRASFVSFLSNGFRLNWLEVDGATQPYVFGLALKGGSYAVGDFETQTDTTTTMVESGFGFQPNGVLTLSVAGSTSQDTPAAHCRLMMGACTSPSARIMHCWCSQDGAATATVSTMVRNDAIYGHGLSGTGAVDALADMQSIDSDGFTAIMDDAAGGANLIVYLAVGNAAPSVSLPPMQRPFRLWRHTNQ